MTLKDYKELEQEAANEYKSASSRLTRATKERQQAASVVSSLAFVDADLDMVDLTVLRPYVKRSNEILKQLLARPDEVAEPILVQKVRQLKLEVEKLALDAMQTEAF